MKFVLCLIFGMMSLSAFSATPETARIEKCLTDYVKIADKFPAEKSKKAELEQELKSVKENCLTKEFISRWQKVTEATDADPLLLAQDTYESWKTLVRTDAFDPKKMEAKIVLGTKGEEKCLILALKKEGQGLRINHSANCSGK